MMSGPFHLFAYLLVFLPAVCCTCGCLLTLSMNCLYCVLNDSLDEIGGQLARTMLVWLILGAVAQAIWFGTVVQFLAPR